MTRIKDSILWCILLLCPLQMYSQSIDHINHVDDQKSLDRFLTELCDRLEPDSFYAGQLSDYIIYTLFHSEQDFPENLSDELFNRSSFVDCGKMLMNDAFVDSLSAFGYSTEYFYDYRYNYLFFCTNQSALITIADELLADGNVNGIVGLWDNYDISKLPSYKHFINRAISNNRYWDIIYLLIPIHNIDNQTEESRLLGIIETLAKERLQVMNFLEYLKDKDAITFEDFMSYFNDPSNQ